MAADAATATRTVVSPMTREERITLTPDSWFTDHQEAPYRWATDWLPSQSGVIAIQETSSMKDCPTTWRFVRTCPNQRLERQCVRCGNSFWPTASELANGPPCGHCV